MSIGTCWGETFIYEESALHHIWNLRQKFAAFWQELLNRIDRTAFYVSIGWGETFIYEESALHHIWNLRQKFAAFWQELLNRIDRTAFYVSIGTCCGETFVYEKSALHQFWNLKQKFAAILQEMLQDCQNCFLRNWKISGFIFPSKYVFFIIWGYWQKRFWLSVQKFPILKTGCIDLLELFKLNFFLKKIFVIHFGQWAKITRLLFGLVRQGCKNRHQLDHMIILRRSNCFWTKRLFTFLGHWTVFCQIFLDGVVHPTCPEEHFEEIFPFETIDFFNFWRIYGKDSSCQRCLSTFPYEYFKKILFKRKKN